MGQRRLLLYYSMPIVLLFRMNIALQLSLAFLNSSSNGQPGCLVCKQNICHKIIYEVDSSYSFNHNCFGCISHFVCFQFNAYATWDQDQQRLFAIVNSQNSKVF